MPTSLYFLKCGAMADRTEGIYFAELDLAQLRKYRASEVHGNAYRHPEKYGLLINTKILLSVNHLTKSVSNITM